MNWQKLITKVSNHFNPEEMRLRKLYNIFASSPEGRFIVGWKDARKLYSLVRENKSENILDLGTGIGASASIMALASGEACRITSLEQKKHCIDLAKSLIPKELQPKIKIILCEPYAFKPHYIRDKQMLSGYKDIPIDRGPSDFVLVDGPAGWIEKGQPQKFPNGDIFNLIDSIKSGGIVFVDSRKVALKLYTDYLSSYFKVIAKWRNYCIMKRTDTPFKI